MEPITGVRMRRTPPAGLGQMLAAARMRRGWRRREAARILGLSAAYMFDLETGRRCPSRTVAEQLADGLGLNEAQRAQLLAAAVDDAGRDHPMRHSPGPEAPNAGDRLGDHVGY